MSSRRPPLPRPPRFPRRAATAASIPNLLYDCSMLPDDETVFLIPTNHDRRFSAHHYGRDPPPPDQIQWIPQFSYVMDQSVVLNYPLHRRVSGGGRGVSVEAIAKHIEIRVLPQHERDRRNDAVGGGLCVVCQDDLCEENGRMARLDCGHEYHVNCINKWLNLRNSCPLCNNTVILA